VSVILLRFAILHQDFLAMQIHAIFGSMNNLDTYFLTSPTAAVFVLAEDCRNLALKIVVPMLTSEHEVGKIFFSHFIYFSWKK
jgi:hypothetical protein